MLIGQADRATKARIDGQRNPFSHAAQENEGGPAGAAAEAGDSDRPLVLRSREAKREPHETDAATSEGGIA